MAKNKILRSLIGALNTTTHQFSVPKKREFHTSIILQHSSLFHWFYLKWRKNNRFLYPNTHFEFLKSEYKQLLQNEKDFSSNFNFKNEEEIYIFLAVYKKDWDAFMYFLHSKKTIKTDINGNNLLMFMIENHDGSEDSEKFIKLIIENADKYRIDLNHKNKNDLTAIDIANAEIKDYFPQNKTLTTIRTSVQDVAVGEKLLAQLKEMQHVEIKDITVVYIVESNNSHKKPETTPKSENTYGIGIG